MFQPCNSGQFNFDDALQADLSEEQLRGFGGYGWPIQSEIERGVRDGDPVATVRYARASFFTMKHSLLRSG